MIETNKRIITTERLTLQPFDITDAEEFYWIINDPDIIRFITHHEKNYDKVEEMLIAHSKVDFETAFFFQIFERAEGRIIGAIEAVHLSKSQSLSMVYMIDKPYRRKGYATEAIKGFSKYLKSNFDTKYRYLNFLIEDSNVASIALAKSLGATMYKPDCKSHKWVLTLENIR